ncbi:MULTISPECIES: cell division protein FtsA [Hyphomonas]|uniref:Cell division protein FtsA n=2 Tax=Hyphomonas adhaerens TaxID=81029 RepID=A0A069E4Y0_9PROT|nr:MULTISPECIES: cell division protein FtsA [Hyphomonas]KCZ85325.1 cell division protein FtsA [Hyphomonas adhaerens MHS-3]MBB41130.1 cell division protein FtsA [Hyphomonas sp.]HAE28084.1 cell division protein FtsA [Hyphomonas adhaerens]
MANAQSRRAPRMGRSQTGTVAALDIGCSKITCLIGRNDGAGPRSFRILGAGRQQSRGFTGGTITDMEGLERAIRLAVEDAEREAGEQISNVMLGITGQKLASTLVTARIDIGGREINQKDVRRIQAQALGKMPARGEETLAAWPVAYRVDEQEGVREPQGMYASELSLLLSVVTAPKSVVKNLVECVGRAHIGVTALIPSSIASGAGTLIDDEIENGAICIDMGAGVTAVSVYLNGSPAWLGLVPAGGSHVTSDLAQGLGTTFAAAERLKSVYGTANLEGPGLAERIEVPRLGDDGRLQAARMERGQLAEIIAPRVEETFEFVRKTLDSSGVRKVLPHRVVLTGGASQLSGVRDVASRILQAPVRLGRPTIAEFLGETLATPAFSTASGLLLYSELGFADAVRATASRQDGPESRSGVVNKVFHWLEENF